LSPIEVIPLIAASLFGLVAGTAVAQTVGTTVIDLRAQGMLGFVLITVSP
jgi:hypothetical protein